MACYDEIPNFCVTGSRKFLQGDSAMKKKTLKDAVDNLFNIVTDDTRHMCTSDREKFFSDLNELIRAKASELRKHQSEIEYGQHIEGLYDIHSRESYIISNHPKRGF